MRTAPNPPSRSGPGNAGSRSASSSATDRPRSAATSTPKPAPTWTPPWPKTPPPAPTCPPRSPREPAGEGAPSSEAAGRDTRTQGQRNHDGLKALLRRNLESGALGTHNGLPVTVIVSTTLQELEKGAGVAVTGGGSLLPMPDLIRMAADAHHYLYVFDGHTGQSLYLGRAKRLANAAQRLVLHARERGCTRPGCTVPGYWAQVHHAVADWKNDGQTDIDDLTFACGPDNRMIENTGWTTRKNAKNQTEWIPPPELDTGQHRVNGYHHPERHLLPENDEGP
nr:HNH endonuclease signature motif containing protein [Mycobacterium sp. NAZ190054]